MQGNDSPVKMPEMHLPPEADRGIELDAGMKQVLALLTAYWGEKRVALAGSPSGVLFVSSAQLAGIWHVTDTGGNYNYRGPDRLCSEVMVMGHPSAAGTSWVQVHKLATTTNAWPIAAKETIGCTITNLNMLNVLIPTANDRVIIAYSV